MKKRKLYHKLVRDRIPEIIQESGKDFKVRQERGERLGDYAMQKLQEEVMEFVENPCADEAAASASPFRLASACLGASGTGTGQQRPRRRNAAAHAHVWCVYVCAAGCPRRGAPRVRNRSGAKTRPWETRGPVCWVLVCGTWWVRCVPAHGRCPRRCESRQGVCHA